MSGSQKWEQIIKEQIIKEPMDRLKKGFLQGDIYSPVVSCPTKIPVMILSAESNGSKMSPHKREIKRTQAYL